VIVYVVVAAGRAMVEALVVVLNPVGGLHTTVLPFGTMALSVAVVFGQIDVSASPVMVGNGSAVIVTS
jgi:hypothetical protein